MAYRQMMAVRNHLDLMIRRYLMKDRRIRYMNSMEAAEAEGNTYG